MKKLAKNVLTHQESIHTWYSCFCDLTISKQCTILNDGDNCQYQDKNWDSKVVVDIETHRSIKSLQKESTLIRMT